MPITRPGDSGGGVDVDAPPYDNVTEKRGGPIYAPSAFRTPPVKLVPGMNPDSLVVYSAIEGQD